MFQGVICCRIKGQEIFLFSFSGKVPVIFHWVSEGLCKFFFWRNIFLQFYEPPDLGRKTFTSWIVLKSKVFLTCINFWEFHDLKACLDVIRLPRWPENEMWNLVSKWHFLCFWPPENFLFELMTNWKFIFIAPKPIFVFKFLNFSRYPQVCFKSYFALKFSRKNP